MILSTLSESVNNELTTYELPEFPSICGLTPRRSPLQFAMCNVPFPAHSGLAKLLECACLFWRFCFDTHRLAMPESHEDGLLILIIIIGPVPPRAGSQHSKFKVQGSMFNVSPVPARRGPTPRRSALQFAMLHLPSSQPGVRSSRIRPIRPIRPLRPPSSGSAPSRK